MDKFKSETLTEVPTSKIPPVPKKCDQCENDSDLITITVYDERGQTHTGAFSEYGYKKNGNHLKDGYTYAHWNSVCSEHKRKDEAHTKLLHDHWVKAGKPRTREECLRAMYKINPAMARIVSRLK